jgi:phosphopantetheinyl transferase
MPLIQHTQLLTGAQVWIWHLSETKIDFERFLNPSDISEIFHKIPHETRQLQKMATRALLHQLNPVKRIDIQYDELGAPGLNGHEGHISISHCRTHVGLLYHPLERCGLDLEELSPRVLKIAPRFLNETEKNWIRPDKNLEEITLIWSTKEAMFKTLGGGGIHFSADLIVYEPFFTNPESGHGEALYQGHKGKIAFEYHFKYLDGVLMVHTIAKRTKSEVA